MDSFLLSDGDKVLFIGDSITDCGRSGGKTSRAEHPLGDGYVKLFGDLACAMRPALKLDIVNRGIGGNTVKDLRLRWDEDVIAERPDWLSVMIGINDLHRYFRGQDDGYPPETFRAEYEKLLDETRGRLGCRIILLDPFYICGPQEQEPARKAVLELMPEYLTAVGELARGCGAVHVSTHEAFQEHLKHRSAGAFCPEPVHPNSAGHMVIAWELAKSLHG